MKQGAARLRVACRVPKHKGTELDLIAATTVGLTKVVRLLYACPMCGQQVTISVCEELYHELTETAVLPAMHPDVGIAPPTPTISDESTKTLIDEHVRLMMADTTDKANEAIALTFAKGLSYGT